MTRGRFSCHTGELGSPTKTVTYRYDDADWGDLLTEYDGIAITYDQIGNPLSDGTRSYTWRHGRQLATLTVNGTTWTNTYDADGMRVSRSNGTVAYSYIYSGSKLRQMMVGTDVLTFTYDAAGTPMSLSYNGTDYYYATNLQGDVVGILDSAGQQVVAYSYDAWGNILSTTGPMDATLGAHNPLRYRGYVYDPETQLYYLQSRYYDPNLGRFLNTDAFAATGQGILGNNMFVYCGNNPTINYDPTGMLHAMHAGGGGKKVNYEYIYSQSDYSVATKRLGVSTIEHSGCGVVATYNALITLGQPKSFKSVLNYYNKRPLTRPALGVVGMSPFAVASYFEDNGYRVILTSNSDEVDLLSRTADASILYYIFDKTYSPMGIEFEGVGHHFVEYHRVSKTRYRSFNTSADSNIRTFRYPSEQATNFVAILIYK